jgi:hypothetical protein
VHVLKLSLMNDQVDFELDDGTHIRNVISEGPSGNDDDLNLTYMYEFRFPKLEPNSEELEKEKAKFKAVGPTLLSSSKQHCLALFLLLIRTSLTSRRCRSSRLRVALM